MYDVVYTVNTATNVAQKLKTKKVHALLNNK